MVTIQVSLVEQEPLTFPEHLGSTLFLFSSVHVAQSLVFYVVFCRSLFVLFLLAIVLSVFLFTASNYPFRVFKLFLRGLV